VKIFGTLVNAALVLLAISVMAAPFPVYGQDSSAPDPDIGFFDIGKVNDDISTGADTTLADAASIAGFTRQPENYAILLLRIIGMLVMVTVLILAAAWLVRRIGVSGVAKVGGGNNMDVIETLYLGQNRSISLARVGDTVYLVGHTLENIVLLEKIEGGKAIELIASSKSGTGITSFKDALNNFMGKMKK